MMDHYVRRMRDLLGKAMEAAGVADPRDIAYEVRGRFFSVAGSGIEVAVQMAGDAEVWCVREVYDMADLTDGGHRPVVETLEMFPLRDDVSAAKAAALRAVERKIDGALDDVA